MVKLKFHPRFPGPLLRRTRGPDPSSKATLWLKAQHEGALPPPCMMAYDRFMAICSHLRYPISMRPSVCALLMLGCYCGGSFNSILQASFTSMVPGVGFFHSVLS